MRLQLLSIEPQPVVVAAVELVAAAEVVAAVGERRDVTRPAELMTFLASATRTPRLGRAAAWCGGAAPLSANSDGGGGEEEAARTALRNEVDEEQSNLKRLKAELDETSTRCRGFGDPRAHHRRSAFAASTRH